MLRIMVTTSETVTVLNFLYYQTMQHNQSHLYMNIIYKICYVILKIVMLNCNIQDFVILTVGYFNKDRQITNVDGVVKDQDLIANPVMKKLVIKAIFLK